MKNKKIIEFEKMSFFDKKKLIISMLEDISKVGENSKKILTVVRLLKENDLSSKILISIYIKLDTGITSIKNERINKKIDILKENKEILQKKLNEEKDDNLDIEKILENF